MFGTPSHSRRSGYLKPLFAMVSSFAMVASVVFALAAPSSAVVVPTLYGVGYVTGGSYAGGAVSNLYTVDVATGHATLVAPVTLEGAPLLGLTAIDFSPSGALYAADNRHEQLLTIDKTTGAATVVGPYDEASTQISDLSFDQYGYLFGWNQAWGDLVRLELNGNVRWVGEFAHDTFCSGLAVDSANAMFKTDCDRIYQVSPQNGGAIGTPVLLHNDADDGVMVNNPADFSPSGVLYTVLRPASLGYPGTGSTLETLDPATGLVTPIGNDPDVMLTGIAFDTATAALTPAADLYVTMTLDPPQQALGRDVTVTVSVENRGPAAANVMGSFPLPSGETYVSDDAAGAYDATTGVWTIGALSAGSTATLQVVATVSATGYLDNEATVSSDVYNPGPVGEGWYLSTGIVPTMTTQPTSTSVVEGAVATFNAEASGLPTPTEAWFVSTDGGTTWTDLHTAGTSLNVTTSLAMNGYKYKAVFTNDYDTVTSAVATLTVTPATLPAVSGLTAVVLKGKITVSWTGTTGTPEPTAFRCLLGSRGSYVSCTNGQAFKAGGTKVVSVQAYNIAGWGTAQTANVTK